MLTERMIKLNSKSSSSTLSFCGALTIVFVVLKLLGKITWSWWWVLSPIWIDFAIALVLIVVMAIIEVRKG